MPLTAMTVHELIRGYFGGMAEFPAITSWPRKRGR
jgi:hypothetical protein